MSNTDALREAAQNALTVLGIVNTYPQARSAGSVVAEQKLRAALAAPAVPPDGLTLLQAGFNNAELLAHWRKKLPGLEPTDRELSAFAVGTEVGWERARDMAAPAVPTDATREAELWRYVATHWTHADFRWNRDAGNSPKSVTVTIKAGPASVGSDGGQFMRFISECVAAAPAAQQGEQQ